MNLFYKISLYDTMECTCYFIKEIRESLLCLISSYVHHSWFVEFVGLCIFIFFVEFLNFLPFLVGIIYKGCRALVAPRV